MRISFGIFAAAFSLLAGVAQAAEIRVFATGAVQRSVLEIASTFEKETGDKIVASFGTAGGIGKKLEAGEPADVVLSSLAGLRDAKALLAEGEPVVVGRVRMGMAVKAGAAKPDISTPDKLKAALLAAPSVAYPDPGQGATSGVHFTKVIGEMGIADQVKAKAVLGKDGFDVAKAVADGKAAIGFTQTTEIGSVPGAEVAGLLPDAYQLVSSYAAALTKQGATNGSAKAFYAAVAGARGKTVFAAEGFEVAK